MIIPALETARLTLRPYTEADIPALLPLIGTREVAATTLRIAHPYSEQNARDFIAKTRREDEALWLAITLRDGGTLCGGVGLRLELEHSHAELGYWLGVPYWGRGYATEAARAMLCYGFDELKLHRILATHFKHNDASGKILRKLGMTREGCMRGHLRKWDKFLDVECYAILRSELESRAQMSSFPENGS
jgi:[ribosomal protein S5]-alanine N-acetyltransferase